MIGRLKDTIRQLTSEGIVLAFSGGVDSSLVLAVLKELRDESDFPLLAVFFHSVFQTMEERMAAERLAGEIGVEIAVLEFDPLQVHGVEDNPLDRCYLCKRYLFGRLKEFAQDKGVKTIMDGTHGDDVQVYRPGRCALKELGVVSPLEALGITKAEVRSMARELNLSVASKPSAPCLATRFPYGTRITPEGIRRVWEGEKALHQIFGTMANIRLRVHGLVARLEIDQALLPAALEKRTELTAAMKALGFDYVTLDLDGFRSGSMDVN